MPLYKRQFPIWYEKTWTDKETLKEEEDHNEEMKEDNE